MTYREPHFGLIGTADLANRWNVSSQRVWQITHKPTFPKPVRIAAPNTRLWSPGDIEQWESVHR